MKIGLDFDGVILNCDSLKSKVAKELYGLDIPASYFELKTLLEKNILTEEQYEEFKEEVYCNKKWKPLMQPVKDALRYIQKLLKEGHELKIITSRQGPALEIAKEWLQEQNIIIDIIGVGYKKSKANSCKGLDLYVDDDLEKLAPLVGIVPVLFLFTSESNRHLEVDTKSARRIESWDHFYQTIQS